MLPNSALDRAHPENLFSLCPFCGGYGARIEERSRRYLKLYSTFSSPIMSSNPSPKKGSKTHHKGSKRNKRCGHHDGDKSCNRSMASWDLHLDCIIHRQCDEEHPCSTCADYTPYQTKAIKKAFCEQRSRDSRSHNQEDDDSFSQESTLKASKRAKTILIEAVTGMPPAPRKRPADTPSEPTDPKVTKLDTPVPPTGFNMDSLEAFMRDTIALSMSKATDKLRTDLEASALTRHDSLKENFKDTLDELSRRFVPQANTILARSTTHTPSATITRYSNSPRAS